MLLQIVENYEKRISELENDVSKFRRFSEFNGGLVIHTAKQRIELERQLTVLEEAFWDFKQQFNEK